MIVSTKGRYALRVMIDLAEHQNDAYIPMKDVANRQHISLKYIEKIMPVLSKNYIVEGVHGKGGGYRLTRSPGEYPVGEILRLTEGSLFPVACMDEEINSCSRCNSCEPLEVWKQISDAINNVVDNVTIADLLHKKQNREKGE